MARARGRDDRRARAATSARQPRILADASPHRGGAGAMVLTGRGVEQHADGTDTVTAAINLALALGLPGRRRSGYGCLTGQGNGQGGREHGQKSDQLPGYRSIEDPDDRAPRRRRCGAWTPESLPGKGVPAVELLGKLGGEVRALMVHGSNPVVSAPDATAVRRRLAALDLLVVCDFVPSETTELADVVLPGDPVGRGGGHDDQPRGPGAAPPPAAVEPAGRGPQRARRCSPTSPAARQPGARSTAIPRRSSTSSPRASAGGRADYSGLSHALLDDDEAALGTGRSPPDPRHAAAVRRAPSRTRTAGRGWCRSQPVARPTTSATTRRSTSSPAGCSRSTSPVPRPAASPALNRTAPESFVELHPQLALRLGIEAGDHVRVTSSRGRATAPGPDHPDIRPDTVFMPFHWAGEALRQRGHQRRDSTRSPGCRSSRCARSPWRRADRRSRMEETGMRQQVVVVGAGMVGHRFVEELVARDREHRFDVHLVGAEEYEPYNRILLTEVLARRCDVATLTLPRPARPGRRTTWGERHRHRPRRADRVDLDDGTALGYDHLVLATGAPRVRPADRGTRRRRAHPPRARPAHHRRLPRRGRAHRRTPGTPSCSAAECSASRPPAAWPVAGSRSPSCTSTGT